MSYPSQYSALIEPQGNVYPSIPTNLNLESPFPPPPSGSSSLSLQSNPIYRSSSVPASLTRTSNSSRSTSGTRSNSLKSNPEYPILSVPSESGSSTNIYSPRTTRATKFRPPTPYPDLMTLIIQRDEDAVLDRLIHHEVSQLELEEAFDLALKHNNLPMVKLLVDWGATPTSHDLVFAAEKNNYELAHFLIQQGAPVKTPGNMALLYAAAFGNLPLVQDLINHGVSAFEPNNEPIIWAAANGKLGVVIFLERNGGRSDDAEAILEAAAGGHLFVVKWLLNRVPPETAERVLLRASAYGQLPIVEYLLNKGARGRLSALKTALRTGNRKVAHYLLPREILPDILDQLLVEASAGGDVQMIKELLQRGADIHYLSDAPLMAAIETDQASAVRYLISQGADIGARNGAAYRLAKSKDIENALGLGESTLSPSNTKTTKNRY